MKPRSPISRASVIPTVRYRDVGAAIGWLQQAFAFEPHRIVRDSVGNVLYGELTFGAGMVMVAPVQDSSFGKLMVQPDEVGGVETQICYLPVADAKAHYARAKTAGAEILFDIDRDKDGGGYSCRDPQGHVWNFGTYDPWEQEPSARTASAQRPHVAAMLLALLVAASAVTFITPLRDTVRDAASSIMARISESIAPAEARQATDMGAHHANALTEARDQLARERVARADAERALNALREDLRREQQAREAAGPAAGDAALKAAYAAAAQTRDELTRAQAALQVAADRLAQAEREREAIEKNARDTLARLRSEQQSAERAAEKARAIAARERSRRRAVERTLRIAKTSPYTPFPVD